jgi:hypothetical protein
VDDWVNSEEQTFWKGAVLAFTDLKTYILVCRSASTASDAE